MIARALPWFEEDNPRDFARWSAAAAIVIGVHAAVIASYLLWWQAPDAELGDDTPIISIELTAPEIDQQEQAKVDEPTPPKETSTDAVIPEEKPPEKVETISPAPRTTVRREASAPRANPSWVALLVKHLQQSINYPSGARARGEQGVVFLDFTMDRAGHVISRRVVKGSGFADLDTEALALLERAQPMPSFPPSMSEEQLELTVPLRFSLR
jgi:protein TonB